MASGARHLRERYPHSTTIDAHGRICPRWDSNSVLNGSTQEVECTNPQHPNAFRRCIRVCTSFIPVLVLCLLPTGALLTWGRITTPPSESVASSSRPRVLLSALLVALGPVIRIPPQFQDPPRLEPPLRDSMEPAGYSSGVLARGPSSHTRGGTPHRDRDRVDTPLSRFWAHSWPLIASRHAAPHRFSARSPS